MRFVSQAEWELLKRHTAAHLHDHPATHRDPATTSTASADPAPPKKAAEPHYFSGNFPGQTGE
jgi:hypothetical protein